MSVLRRMFVFHAKYGTVPPRPFMDNYNFFIQGNSPILKSIDSGGNIRVVGGDSNGSGTVSGEYVPSASTITFTNSDDSTFQVTGMTDYNTSRSYSEFCFLSDYDFKLTDDTFQSKFIVWDSVNSEIVFNWTPPSSLVGDYFRRIAIVLFRNNGNGYDMFFSSEDASSNSRLHKMTNVRIDFFNQKIDWDKLYFVDLPNSYYYQHYDSEHLYYLNSSPANLTRVSITGELRANVFNMTNNPFVSNQDFTWIKGDEHCLYFNRFGAASDGFKSQFVMARKQDPLMEKVLFKLPNDGDFTGFSSNFEIDYINREVFTLGTQNTAETGYGNLKLIVFKHDLDTGDKLGMLSVDSVGGLKMRPVTILLHNRKLFIITSRNPMMYVVDPYNMSVLHSQDFSDYSEPITNPDYQFFGGTDETGWIRCFPYKVRNNELLFGIQSNTQTLINYDLDGYSARTATVISDPINYFTYLTNDPVYQPRHKYPTSSINFTDEDYLYSSTLIENNWRATRSHLTATTTVEYANNYFNSSQTAQPVTYGDLSGLTYSAY
jgi:hypothetical protein